ncbi:MAG: hypothetical protein D3916_10305 [Candidatus Electrothrix sp. MAN1_4]|nr:hypothetical protein [Candidatus Electrothrix sp. MAN1_4]
MERCPVCRAWFKGMPVCRRCKSDLTDLIALEKQAESNMVQAVHQLKAGNLYKSRLLCVCAENLHRTEFGEKLLGFIDTLALEEKKATEDLLWQRPKGI